MRHSAPAISVELTPDPASRRAACVLPVLAALVSTFWLLDHLNTHPPTLPVEPALVLLVTGTLICWVLAALAGRHLLREAREPGRPHAPTTHRSMHGIARTPVTLSWDGHAWRLDLRDGTEPVAIVLQIRLDLGGWLLLRAQPATTETGRTTRTGARWIAMARRDHAAAWHGLRCALYSPRPPHPPVHDR